jgi:hypothetical protein
MNKLKTLVGITALLASGLPLLAQHGHAASPHISISAVVDGDSLTLVYGSPGIKDPRSGEPRKIWGKLVPFGKVWRTGADEATVLTTQKPLAFGDTTLAPGTYSLWTLPAEDGSAKLIINKQTGQWGTSYDEGQDLVRLDLKKDALDCPVDRFMMAIERNSGGGVLKMMWETTQYSIPFTVKKQG